MRKLFRNLLLFVIVYVLLDGCVISKSAFYHDYQNPCNNSTGNYYRDPVECAHWKKLYPKEHARYIKRVNDAAIKEKAKTSKDSIPK